MNEKFNKGSKIKKGSQYLQRVAKEKGISLSKVKSTWEKAKKTVAKMPKKSGKKSNNYVKTLKLFNKMLSVKGKVSSSKKPLKEGSDSEENMYEKYGACTHCGQLHEMSDLDLSDEEIEEMYQDSIKGKDVLKESTDPLDKFI